MSTHLITLKVLLALTSLAIIASGCQDDYRPNGVVGDPCRADQSCAPGLSCVSFVCTDGDGSYTTGTRPPRPDTGAPGFDTSQPPDLGPGFDVDLDVPGPGDTSITPDTSRPDTDQPPDTSTPPDVPLVDGSVCAPGERFCRDPETELVCRNDGSGFLFRTCRDNEVCQRDRCVAQPICDPGEVRCVGDEVQLCTNDGARWLVEQVCRRDERCEQGRCVDTPDNLPNISFLRYDVEDRIYEPGDLLFISGEIANTGDAPTGRFSCSSWLSLDTRLDPNIDIQAIGPISAFDLGPGDVFPFDINLLEVPRGTPPGEYYVIGECDVLEQRVVESNEGDNIAIPRGRITVRDGVVLVCEEDFLETPGFAVIPEGGYELALCDEIDAYLIEVPQDGEIFIEFVPFDGSPNQVAIFSIRDIQTGEAVEFFEVFGFDPILVERDLRAGQYVMEITRLIDTPLYYFLSYDLSLSGGRLPDLTWEFAEAEGGVVVPGDTLFWFGALVNQGSDDASDVFVEVYLSRDPAYSPEDDIFVGEALGGIGLGPGEGFDWEDRLFIPEGIGEGPWFVVFVVDPFDFVDESNERNNTFVSPEPIFVEDGEVPVECTDRFDPSSRFNPAPLGEGGYDGLVTCAEENDYYEICLEANQALGISLFFEHDRGDVDINLLDADGQQLSGSYSVDDREFVQIESVFDGECFIAEVYVCCGGRRNTYSMDITIEDLPDGVVCRDGLEPNNTIDSASPLFEALDRSELALCPERDVDIYRLSAPRGERLSVGAATNGLAELEIRVYDGRFFEYGTAFGANPTVSFEVERDGELFVELRSFGERRSIPYRLFLNDF